MNAGGLFYAYDFPFDSSSNNGFEAADTERIFFVQVPWLKLLLFSI